MAGSTWWHLPPLPTLRDSAGWKWALSSAWPPATPQMPAERAWRRVDLGKSRTLSTMHVRQQSSAQWLDQQIFGRNERPRASADSSDSSVGPEQSSADFWDSFPHACFWQLGVPFVGKCNGRGETGGPLLARGSAPAGSPRRTCRQWSERRGSVSFSVVSVGCQRISAWRGFSVSGVLTRDETEFFTRRAS